MLRPETRERWFGYEHAFDDPVTLVATIAMGAVLLATPVVILILSRTRRINAATRTELLRRYATWLVITPVLLIPILLGAFWTILGVTALSLLCYREYARATGLFREKLVSLLVTLGILAVNFAVLDHWYGFFQALTPLCVVTIAALSILVDRPRGYIQRVALGVFGFTLFGTCLAHLGYIANDARYRPVLILIFLSVELNDVFAFIVGKTLDRHKLMPQTSPNKTLAGSMGALMLTTVLVMLLGSAVFAGTKMDSPWLLAGLGAIISVAGQLGDLMLSSIKRDLGIKDMGVLLPGHGGLLDRFDSLILVAPAAFHYIGYVLGFGLDQQVRILTM
ncbi:MAG: phosphatidate cytidylyltransferase [Planctomycetes bacterium]|nr:phosphatidate cytidylyltransferase [Planctomycetota bacterium]